MGNIQVGDGRLMGESRTLTVAADRTLNQRGADYGKTKESAWAVKAEAGGGESRWRMANVQGLKGGCRLKMAFVATWLSRVISSGEGLGGRKRREERDG